MAILLHDLAYFTVFNQKKKLETAGCGIGLYVVTITASKCSHYTVSLSSCVIVNTAL